MEAGYLVLVAVLPIFLIIGCGMLARTLRLLDTSADLSLMKLIINLLYPALIFSFILGNDTLRNPENLILPPILGLGTVVISFLVSLFIAQVFKLGSHQDRRTFSFITGIHNSTYFTLPIVSLLFDRETIGILLVYNLGVELAIWVVGIGLVLPLKNPTSFLKRILNAPVIAIVLATCMNYYHFDQNLPEPVFKAINIIAQCAIPLALILIGATFADFKPKLKFFTELRIPFWASTIRLVCMPIILLSIAALLPLSTKLEQVIVVQVAMPCAVFPIVLTQHFGGNPDIAFKIVLSTTLLSFLTIPFWIQTGMMLFGL
jgi:predicted permease